MTKTQLLSKTKAELVVLAKRLGLRGISTLRKDELASRVARGQRDRKTTRARQSAASPTPSKTTSDTVKRRAVRKRTAASTTTTTKSRSKTASKKKRGKGSAKAKTKTITRSRAKAQPKHKTVRETKPVVDELPESYGTGRMYLTARDPHWLYSYWDLTRSQMDAYRGRSRDNQLIMRVYQKGRAHPIQAITLQEDSRNWYIYVNQAAASYTVQLGYQPPRGSFKVICRSGETTTPPEVIAPEQPAAFVTIPLDIPFKEIRAMVRDQLHEAEPLGSGLQRLETNGPKRFGHQASPEPATKEQAEALTRLVWDNLLRRTQSGSVELSEWLRRQLSEELSSGLFSQLGFSPTSGRWPVPKPAELASSGSPKT